MMTNLSCCFVALMVTDMLYGKCMLTANGAAWLNDHASRCQYDYVATPLRALRSPSDVTQIWFWSILFPKKKTRWEYYAACGWRADHSQWGFLQWSIRLLRSPFAVIPPKAATDLPCVTSLIRPVSLDCRAMGFKVSFWALVICAMSLMYNQALG